MPDTQNDPNKKQFLENYIFFLVTKCLVDFEISLLSEFPLAETDYGIVASATIVVAATDAAVLRVIFLAEEGEHTETS